MEFGDADKFALKVKTIREGIESDKGKGDKKIGENKVIDKVTETDSIVNEVLSMM